MNKAFIYLIFIAGIGAGWPRLSWGDEPSTVHSAKPRSTLSNGREAAALILLSEAQDLSRQADDARQEKPIEAARLYEAALALYNQLARDFPEWQSGLVKFRQAYCEARVGELSQLEKHNIGWEAGAWAIGPPAPLPSSMGNGTPMDNNISEASSEQAETLGSIYNQAAALLDQHQAQEAIHTLRKGLRIDPDNAGLLYLVGLAQCQLGNFEDALFVLVPLVREHPHDAYGHMALGAAYFGLNRNDAARLALQQTLTLKPDLHAAHFNLAQMLALINPPDKEAARHHYQEARRLGAQRDRKLEALLR